jgi:microtubule-associated protein 1
VPGTWGRGRGQLALTPHPPLLCAFAVFQVRLMITDAARHKLLVLTGQCFENTGELILQSGSFSFQNFIEIFTDQEVGSGHRVWAIAWMCGGR